MIRFKQIKELVIVDLLQTNRQANNANSRKPVDKNNLRNKILLQNLLFLFIYGTFFSTTLFEAPLPEFPGMFTRSLSFMALFIILQLFQLIFNLFYPSSSSLSEYLSLPFSKGELFLSKLLTILISTVSFFLLPILMISMLGWQTGHHLLLVIPIAILLSIIMIAVIILTIFVFIHLLHQIPLFVKHKRTMSIAIYILLFIALFYFIFTNDPVQYDITGIIDTEPHALFLGFHQIFITGSMLAGWLKIGGWVLVVLLLTGMAVKWVIPDLYSDNKNEQSRSDKKKTKETTLSTKEGRSKWRVFAKYQFRQLYESAFIIQMIFAKLYFPIFFLLPALIGGDSLDASFLSDLPNFWAIFMIIGALFALLSVSETTIGGVIISFDKENHHYIKSLPLPFRQYMQFKFWFAFVIEWLIGFLILVIVSIIVDLPLSVTFFSVMGYTLGIFGGTLYYFMRDYRLLNLTWSNFTELQQRGMNQFIRAILNVLGIFAGVFLTVGLGFWLMLQENPWIVNGVSALILLILFGVPFGIYQYSKKYFWVKFNQ